MYVTYSELIQMMLGSKDAIRIVPYFVLTQFYPIFAHRGFRLLTLASILGADFGSIVQYVLCIRSRIF